MISNSVRPVHRQEFGGWRDRLDDVDQDAVRILRYEMPLPERFVPEIEKHFQSIRLHLGIDGVDIVHFEIQQYA